MSESGPGQIGRRGDQRGVRPADQGHQQHKGAPRQMKHQTEVTPGVAVQCVGSQNTVRRMKRQPPVNQIRQPHPDKGRGNADQADRYRQGTASQKMVQSHKDDHRHCAHEQPVTPAAQGRPQAVPGDHPVMADKGRAQGVSDHRLHTPPRRAGAETGAPYSRPSTSVTCPGFRERDFSHMTPRRSDRLAISLSQLVYFDWPESRALCVMGR